MLEAKAWVGLSERQRPPTVEDAQAVFRQPDHVVLAHRIFESSVTLLENEGLPLRKGSTRLCVVGTRAQGEDELIADKTTTVASSREVLFREFAARTDRGKTHVLNEEPDGSQIAAALAATEGSDTVVFAATPKIRSYNPLSGRASGGQIEFARRVVVAGKHLCLCILGSPYAIAEFPAAPVCLTTYAENTAAAEATVRVLFGEVPARGRLPVDLSTKYSFGYGRG